MVVWVSLKGWWECKNNSGNNGDTGYLKGKGEEGLVGCLEDWNGQTKRQLGVARARYLNTGRLSEGYRDPGLDPKIYSGWNYGAGTRRADQLHRQLEARLGWHDRRRGKQLGKVQGRGLTRGEGKARANRSLACCHSAARRVPARRAAVLRRPGKARLGGPGCPAPCCPILPVLSRYSISGHVGGRGHVFRRWPAAL
jgi:hypothetical protein